MVEKEEGEEVEESRKRSSCSGAVAGSGVYLRRFRGRRDCVSLCAIKVRRDNK